MAAKQIYECEYCETKFKTAERLVDHKIICKIIVNPSSAKSDAVTDPLVETIGGDPTAALKIIKHLVRRIDSMEKDLTSLKTALAVKIDTLEWLNKSVRPPESPDHTFTAFMTHLINISPDKYTELLTNLEHNVFLEWLKSTISSNISEYIRQIPQYTHRPIFVISSTTTRSETFRVFYYNMSNDDPIPLWKPIPDDIFDTIWYYLSKKILAAINEWRNQTDLSESEENIFQTTLLKIIDNKKANTYIKEIRHLVCVRLQYTRITYELT